MYHVLSESQNGNVGIKIEEKLTKDDYELLIPLHQQTHTRSWPYPITLRYDGM